MKMTSLFDIIKKNVIIIKYKSRIVIKTIARELGISKNTVKSYIRYYDQTYHNFPFSSN